MRPTLQELIRQALRLLRKAGAAVRRALSSLKDLLGRHHAARTDSEAPRAAEVTAPPEEPAAALHAEVAAGAFIDARYGNESGQRDYKLFVPLGHDGQALPLVVMLHGCTQDPDDFALGTGMNECAREQGFFVLYPAQAPGANPSRCWNWFKHEHQQRDRGEPALLAGMTQAVMARYPIDPHRVYVAGLSAGGSMAAILGHAYPDLFAAVGVHSGLARGAAFDATSAFSTMKDGQSIELLWADKLSHRAVQIDGLAPPAPTIVFHGDDDATVHLHNAKRVIAACLGDELADDVGELPGPTQAAVQIEQGRSPQGISFTRSIYPDPNAAHDATRAEQWIVHGIGHAWSGGHAHGSYTDARGPDATREMLRFFFEHPLRAQRQ